MRATALCLGLAMMSCSASAPRVTAPAAPRDAAPQPLASGRLPGLANPVRYDLSLTLDPRREDFSGEVSIEVDVPAPTRAVVLHARGLTVRTASVVTRGRATSAGHATRRAGGGGAEDEELVLTTPEALPAGRHRLDIAFEGRFDPALHGLFRVRVGDDWYAFSQFEPVDARRAFPCFDEPGFKVPFAVRITAPDGMSALSNMPATGTGDAREGLRVTTFAPTPPTPTYLTAFAVGPFDFHEGPRDPVPIRVATVRGRAALGRLGAETAAAHLRILGDYFGRAYPYPKLDLVAVPDFLPGAMENPGLITFRDTALLLDPERAPSRARHYISSIIAHELAHQWFGNLVTMAWWDDLWLNEGFATWAASRVMRTWRPELGERMEEVQSAGWARDTDGLESARAVRSPVTTTAQAMEGFDATAYGKGAALLAMLESFVGEARFRDGVQHYLRAHQWGNATAGDLVRALSDAAGRDLAPVANSFLDQPGVPLVDARLACAPDAPPRVTLRQSRFTAGRGGAGDARWSIPVCVRFPVGETAHTRCEVLAQQEGAVTLDLPAGACPAWFAPNAGARGYYWYALTPETLRALTTTPRALDAAERMDLLADMDALYDAGDLPVEPWLEAVARLVDDADPHVAARAIGHLGTVEHRLLRADEAPRFRAWVTGLLAPRAQALGWAFPPGEDEARRELRRVVLTTLGMYTDDPQVHAQAEAAARRYLADPASVDADLASVALPVASRHANIGRFEALRAALGRAPTPQDRALVLGAMLTFDDLEIVRRAYDLVLTDAVRVQDLRVLFGRTGPSAAHRALLLTWAREHLDALRERLGRHVGRLTGALAWRCDEASIREAEAFLQRAVGDQEGVARGLRQAGEYARRCAAVRERDASRAAAAFVPRPVSAPPAGAQGEAPRRAVTRR